MFSIGIQLLCMIGKGSQACRYLVSYNKWQQAVWLAKCSLLKDDYDTVMKSWSDHLLSNRNQVSFINNNNNTFTVENKYILFLSINFTLERLIFNTTMCYRN